MRGRAQHSNSTLWTILFVTAALLLAAVSAFAQSSVPPTARQAAASPAFASRLHPATTPPAVRQLPSGPACSGRPQPQDQVVYENGPVNGTTDAWTLNFGYVVSDTFTLGTAGTVTGFDFYTWEFPGDSLSSVQWSITSAPNGGTVYGSGTVSGGSLTDGFISTNQYGYNIDKISARGLNATLSTSGTYWFNLQNASVPSGDPIYWDENSGTGCNSPGCPSQAVESAVGTIPSEAFDIVGKGGFGCFEPAGKMKVIHDFAGKQDAGAPGVSIDNAGNLYGACGGGDTGYGLAYKLDLREQSWVFTPLYSFTGGYNGQGPGTPLVGPGDVLYGNAGGGIQNCGNNGDYDCGLVYSLRPRPTACLTSLCSWTDAVLYRFTDNASAGGISAFDQAGNLYGTISRGGGEGDYGAVFELSPSISGWTEKILYTFTGGTDGAYPGSLLLGNDGNLYGVTSQGGPGGPYGLGTVFQLAPSGGGWTENVIYTFQNQGDGYYPTALVQDSSGNLFGLALYPDQQNSPYQATIFMLSPVGGKWVFTTLFFTSGSTVEWFNNLTVDAAGNLYVTGQGEDADCMGIKDVYGFAIKGVPGSNGWEWSPLAYFFDQYFDTSGALAVDAQGNLYGTTSDCGKHGGGTVWQISP